LVARPGASRTMRILVWILSAAAVALTTAKTPLFTLLCVPPALWILRLLPHRQGRDGARFPFAMATLAGLMAAMVIVPVSSATRDLLFKYSFGDVGFLTFASMIDRTTTMWPNAFALIAGDHNGLEWALGRGLGGIGSAQTIFEPLDTNTADNMFVFLYVTFGASCIVFGFAIFSRFRAVHRENGERFLLFFALAACILTLGLATNVIESIVPAIALGILAGKASSSQILDGRRVTTRSVQPPDRDTATIVSRA
ncbi:MAG TPA: hypothetical protein VGY48_35600, partial [Vicinamibacterales bacterium]|nr:hypothetical protein [Vicinamibacterales bacterium]